MTRLAKQLTVVIPTLNEAHNIELCLRSVASGVPIFVVDSGSSDSTCTLATSCGATVVNFAWDGYFPKKRNWFLLQGRITTPWVLFLDADERLTPEFIAELEVTLQQTTKVGFWIRYADRFMGQPLSHGIPMRKLALFRPDAGRYERIDDERWTHLDMEVHEHPVLDGEVGEIRAKILHHDENPLEKWIARHNDYSTWEARRIVSEGARGRTLRQRIKYGTVQSRFFPVAYFAAQYFAYGGFLDGAAGLKFAAAKALYFATVRQKVAELRRRTGAS